MKQGSIRYSLSISLFLKIWGTPDDPERFTLQDPLVSHKARAGFGAWSIPDDELFGNR